MEFDFTTKLLFGIALLVMLGAYAFLFSAQGHYGRKKKDQLPDSAFIATSMKQKHDDMLLRAEEEKRMENLKEEVEGELSSGEHTFPHHKTKQEWIEEEYHVGEEKETVYPQHHSPDKKPENS
jgi:hypothetical protein